MNALVANVVSCSLVAPSLGRRRCGTVASSSNLSSSSPVRSPKQQVVYSAESKKMNPCASAVNMHRIATDVDRSVVTEEEERCAEQGIVCHRTETGEITCEGFDEGPHFHPIARAQQRTVMMNASHMAQLTRGVSQAPSSAPSQEISVYTVVEEKGRGECYCEGKDES
ncbi:hypothetical protein MPTK1_4g23890 [Marchantia polymorpha subsp. ruderalis]|nr:hypothetical protein MARPO_0020s0148 [Marchantia polymorpha]BBN09940.1 hypothetical protein Mp_4g23890 [Marchantia polymorpha subsp. ruderalis]|eukprot:PTQ44515.1 hypothetical protein MARPO_0020s0148 [Marchantia polymorpha]